MRILPLFLLLALPAAPALAQTGNTPRFGVGVSLDMTPTDGSLGMGSQLSARTGNIHFPLQVSTRIRIEPMAGFASESDKSTDTFMGQSTVNESRLTVWRLGVGVFYVFQTTSPLRLYAGPRLGLRRRSLRQHYEDPLNSATQKVSQRDWFLSAAFGGEYFPLRHFSVGGEAQVTYTGFGDLNVETTPPVPPGSSTEFGGHSVDTAGLIVVRWYVGK